MAAQIASLIPSDQLIPVHEQQIGDSLTHVCRASDLHQFLRVQTKFADWIRARVRKYLFVENQDFVLVSENSEIKGKGGDRRHRDYLLTLDMAKELSMVENNEQGRAARRYFIRCEKQALAGQQALFDNYQKVRDIENAFMDWTEEATAEIQRLQGNVPPEPAVLQDPAAALAAVTHVLTHFRYLLNFTSDLRVQFIPVMPGSVLVRPDELPKMIAGPNSPIARNLLPDIIRAAAGRL